MPNSQYEIHWQNIYAQGEENKRGWYQSELGIDAQFVIENAPSAKQGFIDIGAGVSNLASFVLQNITEDVTILDISAHALETTRAKLSKIPQAQNVQYIKADILNWHPQRAYGLWHDRAMFHFLETRQSRLQYFATLEKALLPKGKFILSGFAPNGPEKCSGLPVNRLNPDEITNLLSKEFKLEAEEYDTHQTPSGNAQNYVHLLFSRQ